MLYVIYPNSREWQEIKGFDKPDFYGIVSIYHQPPEPSFLIEKTHQFGYKFKYLN
jgi:hypothetical protein